VKYIIAFLAAIVISHFFTPIVRHFARKNQIIDKPDPENPGKTHKKPIPLIGGFSIYVAVFAIIFAMLTVSRQIFVLFLGGTAILLLGLIDDIFILPYLPRLVIQTAISLFVFLAGDIRVGFIQNDWISMIFTLFWIVGIANSMNLMDNLDGATGGIGFISSIILFMIGIYTGNTATTVISLAIAGACLGFLRYNSKPASIFLGDTGSLFLGYMLATVSLLESEAFMFSLSAIFIFPFVLGVPIFDTTLATILRIKNHRPVYLPDKSNLTFRLFSFGLKEKGTLLLEYAMGFCFGLGALLLVWFPAQSFIPVMVITTLSLVFLGMKLNYCPFEEEGYRSYSSEPCPKSSRSHRAA
jgi:UDP-GlcNAc:undecaprenyl-phosphate GlcNAc-1-phosphate transferase